MSFFRTADQRDVALNDTHEHRSSCKVLEFLSCFNQICAFSTYLNKSLQCYKNSSSGNRVDKYGQTRLS